MHMFLGEVLRPLSKPMLLYCNNQLAIAVAKDNQFHACMKHIDIQYHFIRETITWNILEVRYCPTQHMVANIFTKALPMKTFEQLHTLLGIVGDSPYILIGSAGTELKAKNIYKKGHKSLKTQFLTCIY